MAIICSEQVRLFVSVQNNLCGNGYNSISGNTAGKCQVNWSTVCMFSSLLSGRISTLRDETGAVSIATYLKTRTESAGHMSAILHMTFVLLCRNLLRYKF